MEVRKSCWIKNIAHSHDLERKWEDREWIERKYKEEKNRKDSKKKTPLGCVWVNILIKHLLDKCLSYKYL